MPSRPSSLLAYRDLESFPTMYVSLPALVYMQQSLIVPEQDHYIFCYEVVADFVERMETYNNFATLM